MKSYHFKSGVLSLGVVVIICIISGCFGYVYTFLQNTQETQISNIPHIYYSEKTITSIDAQGNSRSNETIYRIDGLQGQPEVVAQLPTGFTGATWMPSTFQYTVWSGGASLAKTFPVTLENDGHERAGSNSSKSTWGNVQDEVLSHYQWVHPDGTYATLSEIYCTDTPPEGPCAQEYRFTATDLSTGNQAIYTAKDFGGLKGQWMVTPLVSLSKTTALVSLNALQEPLMGFLGIIHFDTGDIQKLYGMAPDYTGLSINYSFLRLSDDGKSAIFINNYPTTGEGYTITAVRLSDGVETNLATNIPSPIIAWPEGSSVFNYEATDGLHVVQRDIVSGAERVVAASTLAQYLQPTRFVATTSTSSSGIYQGRLVVTDTVTKRQRVIYNQQRNENAYSGNANTNGSASDLNARIGDHIYNFLGIEQ